MGNDGQLCSLGGHSDSARATQPTTLQQQQPPQQEQEKKRRLTKLTLSSPGEGASVEAEGAALGVSTESADETDALVADLGASGGAAELKLALLLVHVAARTGEVALVPGVAADTHLE